MISEILSFSKTAFGLAKDSPFKLLIILGIISAVIGFVEFRLHQEYEKGVSDTENKYFEQQQKAMEELEKKYKDELAKAIEEKKEAKKKARELQIELDKKPKVLIREIFEVTNNPDCSKLCPDAHQLWIDITQKPSGISNRSRSRS